MCLFVLSLSDLVAAVHDVINHFAFLVVRSLFGCATVDSVGKAVYWDLSHQCEFNSGGKWFERNLGGVLENSKAKILWDFAIQTD